MKCCITLFFLLYSILIERISYNISYNKTLLQQTTNDKMTCNPSYSVGHICLIYFIVNYYAAKQSFSKLYYCVIMTMQPQQTHHTLSYQKVSLQTQSRLIDTFQQHRVPEFYQNIFISYVKNLQPMQAELSMREEIQSLSNNSSFIQSFSKSYAQKQKYQGYTRLVIGYEKEIYSSQTSKLIKICELIMQLRNIHSKCAYFLLKIRQKYEESIKIYQSIEKYYYYTFAIKLDSFRKELQKTQISHFIDFDKEYDPFFMHLKLKQCHNDKRCDEAIQLLMQLTVEDTYKYLKMEKIMMDWLYMHSKKKILEKNLQTIDLPLIRSNQPNFQNEKSIDKIFRNSRLLKRNRDNGDNYIRGNRSSLIDVDFEMNKESQIFSLEKYQKQKKQTQKEQGKMEYLNNNINKLLEKNISSPQQPVKYRYKIKTQTSSNERDKSNFVGRIKRFKISNFRTVQNSPVAHQSRRSETLPLSTQLEINKDNFNNDYSRNQAIRASLTPKYFIYDSQQKSRSISKDRIKLQKINAYQITIRCKKNNDDNELTQTKQVAKKENFKSNKDQELTQTNQKVATKANDPSLTSTLRESQDFRPKDTEKEINNKKQAKLTKTQPKTSKIEDEKNHSLKKEKTFDQDQPLKRVQIPQKHNIKKDNVTVSDEDRKKQNTTKGRDEQIDQDLAIKQLIQEDLIKRKSKTNPIKAELDPKSNQNTKQANKEPEKVVTQSPNHKELKTNQNLQQNNYSQPPQPKEVKNKTEQSPQAKPIIKKQQTKITSESNLQSSEKKQQKRQIKMRVGKYTLQTFKQYLKNYKFHGDTYKMFDVEKITKELQFQQTYVTEFLVNGQPGVIAIIYLIANCKLIVRLWALQERQDPKMSFPLLKKFIDYIQKQTTHEYIYYKGVQFPELSKLGFVKKKDDLFERQRTLQLREVQLQFQQCISLQCSQIKFIQKQKEDILVSAEIQKFTLQNSSISQILTNLNEDNVPPKLKQFIKISHKIDSFAVLNKILYEKDYDSYQVSSKMDVPNIDLSLFNFLSDFRDPFVASQGFIKFYGNLVKQTQQQMVCSIKLSKNNGRVCFYKGYNTTQQVLNDFRPQQSQKKVQFWVPMFNKKLYGRFKNYKSATDVCYANWDISISWQDQLQGALKHPQRVGVTFQQSPFYISIQVQGNLLYIFEVNEDDYIY